jgi:hypothetical protein
MSYENKLTDSYNKSSLKGVNRSKALLKAKIIRMLKNGRQEVNSLENLKTYPIGSLLSYVNKKGTFKIGGYLVQVEDETFVYELLDFSKKFRVKMSHVDAIWIGRVDKLNSDYIDLTPTNRPSTSFPVKIGDSIIYYAKNNYDVQRYCCTDKYISCTKWHEKYGQYLN